MGKKFSSELNRNYKNNSFSSLQSKALKIHRILEPSKIKILEARNLWFPTALEHECLRPANLRFAAAKLKNFARF